MNRLNSQFSGKMYAVKRQYPILVDMEKRMQQVKKELNRGPKKPQ